MIKIDDSNIEIRGTGIDILFELGVITEHIIANLEEDAPRDTVIRIVNDVIKRATERSCRKDLEEQKGMQEVAEILKRMNKTEEMADAD